MDGAVLLTGATGLLGRYLLRDLLHANQRVAVLVRSSGTMAAEDRVAALLATWARQGSGNLPMPRVLSGDITAPDLGLSRDDFQWVEEHCDLMLHNAASLSFIADRGTEGEPWQSNVEGTRNVLELCRRAGIADFHHVSTAYVCGLRTGRVFENEGNVGQEFGNDYEQSKVQAEEMVQSADFLSPPTIFRPSIIVGDSETGFTTTFHGFYALVRLAVTLQRAVENAGYDDVSLPLHGLFGDEVKNLIPVDYVSAVMTEIITHREHWGRTYHITPELPVRLDLLQDVCETVVGRQGSTAFSGPGSPSSEQPKETKNLLDLANLEVESAFYDQMKVYESYFRNDPEFDRRNLLEAAGHIPCPTLDRDRLLKLAQTAVTMNFRHRDPRRGKVASAP